MVIIWAPRVSVGRERVGVEGEGGAWGNSGVESKRRTQFTGDGKALSARFVSESTPSLTSTLSWGADGYSYFFY